MIVRVLNAEIAGEDGVLFNGFVTFDDQSGLILEVERGEPENSEITPEAEISAEGAYLFPGLIDAHTHGRAGYDFNTATEEQLEDMSFAYLERGITSVAPTLASATLDELCNTVKRIENASKRVQGAAFVAHHLEGRYLNVSKRGAHNANLIAPLIPDELDVLFSDASLPIHISAAFELDTDGEFAKRALSLGATLGLGHTCATYDQALKAEANGVTSYTHLMNAMPPLHHREGGAVLRALTGDKFCEVICDGIHICPEMVEMIYKMVGSARLVLISDSMEATGCPDGRYTIAGMPVNVSDGRAYTTDGALAGSTLSLFVAVLNLADFCRIPIETAMLCATVNPARMLGIYDSVGSVTVGKRADMCVVDPDTRKLVLTISRGRFCTVDAD